MPQHHPRHLDGYVREAGDLFKSEGDEYHHYFQVVCRCDNKRFHLHASDKGSVKAICVNCRTEITICDFALYPASVKLAGPEAFTLLADSSDGSEVYVMYEYGEFDDDMEFDPDDITWCAGWIKDVAGHLKLAFNHETA